MYGVSFTLYIRAKKSMIKVMLTITKITEGIFKNIKKQLETTPKHVQKNDVIRLHN